MTDSSSGYQRFFAEVKRRRVFRVMAVYGVVAFAIIEAADIMAPRMALPDWTVTLVIWVALFGFPLAIVLAWAFDVTPKGVQRTAEAAPGEIEAIMAAPRSKRWLAGVLALIGMSAMLVGAWYVGRQSAPAVRQAQASIAVLPFANMSPDGDQAYFGDGLAEELLDALTKVEGLRVAARTSSFRFRGDTVDISDVARQLGVQTVLEGSVRSGGGRVRITAQLVNADGFHIWSDRYDRTVDQMEDLIRVQEEIAQAIVAALSLAPDTILVEGDRIATIGSAADVQIPSSAQIIDGEGLFAIPGLADLHVHMEADDLALFLANGITTVREMNGSPEILELRAEVRAGDRIGPSIYVAGPLLAGIEQRWRHRLVRDADEARQEVLAEREAGFDFVKVYEGLSAETYRAIIATATALDMPVVGHIPEDVGLDSVIGHKQRSIEHVEQIVRATVGHELDRARIPDIVRRIRGGATSVTPTLAAMEILSTRRSAWFDGLFTRPQMRYVPPEVRGWWESLRQPAGTGAALRDTVVGGAGDWIEFYRELTAALAEAGVPILVGTDTPNPLLVPGFSLQHELEALVRAGLEPARVLRAATHDAAVFLDAGKEFGALQPGLRADIVLVAGNPLENLSYLGEVRGLVLRGDWITRESLVESLEAVGLQREPLSPR